MTPVYINIRFSHECIFHYEMNILLNGMTQRQRILKGISKRKRSHHLFKKNQIICIFNCDFVFCNYHNNTFLRKHESYLFISVHIKNK